MSALDIVKDKEVKKVKERQGKGIRPLKSKEKSYFSKIRSAVKKQQK